MKRFTLMTAIAFGVAIIAFAYASSALAAPLGEVAIFTDATSWIAQGTAAAQGQDIADALKSPKDVVILSDKDIGTWAEDHTDNGQADIIITYGYFPTSLYPPGNVKANGSVGEKFLEGGNIFLNTADYIFYVTAGGGANAAQGLVNMMDINVDMWGDGTAIKPTDDGKKYTPSLKAFTSNRPFKADQIVDPWEIEVVFGDNGADPAFFDPGFVHDTETDGRIGIVYQVSNDGLPRVDVIVEMIDNYLAEVLGGQAVDPKGKAATTWGELKSSF